MNKRMVFLTAGRLVYRKGQEFLLDAIDGIPESYDFECRFIGKGPDSALLEKRIEGLSVPSRVKLLGAVPFLQMSEEYAKADVFIMPSIRETTGNVLLEAIAAGKPVITIGRFGGATFLDNTCAWLYDGNSYEEFLSNLRKFIIECIENPELVIEKGINARNRAKEVSWPKKVELINEAYKSLLKG